MLPFRLRGDSILAINQVYVSERPERGQALVVHPDSASWAIISFQDLRILRAIEHRKRVTLSSLEGALGEVPERYLRELVLRFWEHGFINIDGVDRFPPPEIMWRPFDEKPIYPNSVYFHVTDGCNFACKYCYAKAEPNKVFRTMSYDTAMKVIRRALLELPSESLFFVFHGGEPLIAKDMITRVVRDTYEKLIPELGVEKRVKFSLQTNASLLDDSFIDFTIRYGVNIGVSLDGPREVHDKNRVLPSGAGTFDLIYPKIIRYMRRGARIGVLAVAHEPEDAMRIYEFFVSRGIYDFKLNYTVSIGRGKDMEFDYYGERPKKMGKAILEVMEAAVTHNALSGEPYVKVRDWNYIVRYLVSKRREFMCMRSPCGVGRSIIAFGPDGEMYPCEEMSSDPRFIAGSIHDPRPLTEIIDTSEMIRKLRGRRVEAIDRCKGCPWRYFCGGRCTHKAIQEFGTPLSHDPMCDTYRYLFEEVAWRLVDDRDAWLTLA